VLVRAEVAAIENLSSQADWAEIVERLVTFPRPLPRTFLTQGEPR
jgi:hypothetical protein